MAFMVDVPVVRMDRIERRGIGGARVDYLAKMAKDYRMDIDQEREVAYELPSTPPIN